MSEDFDAYHKWLGIPAKEQPPHHYRLLAIPLFEQDRDVIAIAADRQMSHLRTFQSGPQSELSQRLLNEVSAARMCLLDAAAKVAYDAELKARLKPAAKASGAKKTTAKSAPSPASERPGSDRSVWPVDAPLPEYHRSGGKSASSKPSKSSSKQKSSAARTSKNQSPTIVAAVVVGAAVLGIVAYFAFANRQSPSTASAPDKPPTTKPVPAKKPPVKKPSEQAKQLNAAGNNPKAKPLSDDDSQFNFKGIIRQPPQPTSPQTEPIKPAVPKHDPTQPPLEESDAELARYRRGAAVDLLSLIDVVRDGVHGEWRRDGDALITPGQTCSVIQIRYDISDEYELTAVVERISGDGCLNPGVVVGNARALVVIDGIQDLSGLDEVDGQRYPDNSTVFHGPVMNDKQPHTIVCAVRRRAVRASCDGKLLFHWVGDPERLTVTNAFQMPNSRALVITDYGASFRITKYELRPLLPPE